MERPMRLFARLTNLELVAVVAVITVVCAAVVAVSPKTTVSPLLMVVPVFVAAIFLSVRASAVTAIGCWVLLFLLSWFEDYRGWALWSRVLTGLVCSVVATAMAAGRIRRESQIRVTAADLLMAQLLEGVVETTPDPIYVKDSDGRYLVANAAAARLGGLESPAQVIGHRDRDLLDAERAAVFEGEDRRAFADGGSIESEEALPGTEPTFVLHTRRTILRDRDGTVIGVAGIGRDITARHAAERELRALQAQGAEIASSFQQSMLELALQADPRLGLSVHYKAGTSALETGGDWYDVIPLPDGRIAIVVGDVVGHGLQAATVMGRLRGACRGLLLAAADPATVLSHLDDVAETIDGARYATCCCVIVDPAARKMLYSSAGHPPILLLTPGEQGRFLFEDQGPPLAIRGAGIRPANAVDFVVGSRIVVYTDGLVERRNEILDVGLERLRLAADSGRGVYVENECDRISRVVFEGVDQDDDVAIVCAELISHNTHEFTRQFEPDTRALAGLRHDLRLWLTGNRLPSEPIETVLLAVGEALANALEHADAAGVNLRVHRLTRRSYRATIADSGHWQSESDQDQTRGRGIAIMKALAEEVQIDRTAAGTTVSLTFAF